MFGVIINDNKTKEQEVELFDTKEEMLTFVNEITDYALVRLGTTFDYFVTYSKDEIEKYF